MGRLCVAYAGRVRYIDEDITSMPETRKAAFVELILEAISVLQSASEGRIVIKRNTESLPILVCHLKDSLSKLGLDDVDFCVEQSANLFELLSARERQKILIPWQI